MRQPDNKILKVGIVGAGGAGLSQYYHFNSIKGCRTTAFFDPHDAGIKRAQALSPLILATKNFDDFLNAPVDIVSVCSPDKTHTEYIVKSLAAGKHVLCEKPLTDSLNDCRAILQAEKNASGCVMAVQHQMRFLPVHLKMKEIIQGGKLGKIFYMEGFYVHNLTQRAKLYDLWRFRDNATPLVYSGCHFVDLLRWLLEDEVTEIFAMANNIAFPEYPESDLNIAFLRFRSGILGKVITAFGAGRPQDHSVRIYGNEQSIENNLLFDKDGHFQVFHRPFIHNTFLPQNSSLRNKLGAWYLNAKSVLISRAVESLMTGWRMKDYSYSVQSYPLRVYEHSYAVNASITDFIDAIRRGRKPKCRAIDAAKTVVTCLAGVESYRAGRVVPLGKYWLKEFNDT